MRVVSKEEVLLGEERMLRVLSQSLFVYPTDTVYGLGCVAQDEGLVAKLRNVKMQHTRPFSVIVPSRAWVEEHCVVTKEAEEWLQKLPGPYTLILRLKEGSERAVAWNVTMGLDTLGVRIPDSWFSSVVSSLGVPVVTTSANPTGGDVMVALEDLHPALKKGVDVVVYDGPLQGSPSTLVYVTGDGVVVKKR
ncbi:hypothetical protein D6783_01305 [Candidatus Woesearchaeota archaeon]|nr:MAG: hypothetical protein D6783_01305 [Candidatus Woesearchaeota archaeon]